jgi:hypothetical protein
MSLQLVNFLLEQGGPILRWLTLTELTQGDSGLNRAGMMDELLSSSEVLHWLSLLGSGPVHHSMDASVENVLAKLGEFGVRAGMPGIDQRVLPYCAVSEGEPYHGEALILVPFLVRLGYTSEPRVAAWLSKRIDVLSELALTGDYDLYMDDSERQRLPPSQQTLHGSPKLFYKTRFNHHWGVLSLPTCYDLLALASLVESLPQANKLTRQKVESIVAYLLDPAFQDTPGGYIWNPGLHRAYAAGRVFLACLPRENEPAKLVLFLEMLAHFDCGRASTWFQQGLANLESFRTARGTYCFPAHYLSEKHNYFLYAGMHMGLGESPRTPRALELESTFRMLRIKTLLSKEPIPTL